MAQGTQVTRLMNVFLLAGGSSRALTLLALAATMTYCAQAQNIEGQPIAAQYGEFEVQNEGNGFAFDPANCNVTGGGENFPAFTTGTPVKVVDALPSQTEVSTTVTAFLSGSNCAVSLFGLAYQHASFYLTSGTGGLQEALNNEKINAGGNNTIILNARWYELIAPRTASTVISTVSGSYNFGLVDVTTNPYTSYNWNGSQYVQAVAASGGSPSGAAGGVLSGNYPNPGITNPLNLSALNTISAGTFSNNSSSPSGTNTYLNALINGCSPATEVHSVQYNYAMTSGVTGCVTGPAPGSGVYQINGIAGLATSQDANVVGGYFQGRALGNSMVAWGINPVVQDVAGLTSNVVLFGQELDVQPYNPVSTYSGGYGLAINLINNTNNGGTYPFPALAISARVNGGSTPAYWSQGINSELGALPASEYNPFLYIQSTCQSTGSANCASPAILEAFEEYGSGATREAWNMYTAIGTGATPTTDNFVLGHNTFAGPAGQTHTFELANGIQLQLDGSTSGSAVLSAPATGGGLNISAPGGINYTNPGTFSNTASNFPNTTAINGCNLGSIFQIPQYTAYLTAAMSACATAPTNSPGSAYNQTAGGFFAATASGIGSGSGESTAVGVSEYGIITGNNTLAFGANPLVEDFNDGATNQQLIGEEVDVQPQKAASAYAYNGYAVLGTHYALYNQGGQGGTYGPAVTISGSNFGSPAYWGQLIYSSVGSLGPASVVANINSIANATSGANSNCPQLLNAYEAYWTGSASQPEGWVEGCTVGGGTNPAVDTFYLGHSVGTPPAGQTHTFELKNGIQIKLDGSTSGSTVLSASATGGTLNLGSANATVDGSGNLAVTTCTGCGGGMVYPGAGVPNSTGGAWGTSYTVGTGPNNLLQLNASSQIPAVNAALLTSLNASALASGTVPAAQMPALTGDCTTSAGAVATTCTKTNGTAFGTAATQNTGTSGANVPLLNGANTHSGAATFSAAGAASTPGVTVSGAPYTGGSATTTLPQFYLNAGAAVSTFSTSGTMFGVNAPSGFGGHLLNLFVNGSSTKFRVDASGDLFVAGTTTLSSNVGLSSTNAPTMAAGAAAGTSPSCTTVTGNNNSMVISCTTGTSTTASATLATITFNGTLGTVPNGCNLMARNSATALVANDVYTTAPTSTTFTIAVATSALTASTAYSWSAQCF